MPPKKKAKILSFEKVFADIESSSWTADQYSQIIDLCTSKSSELQEEENLDLISSLITKYLLESQEKLTNLKNEKEDLVKRIKEGDETVDEDDLSNHEECLEGAVNTVSLFSKLKVIELEHEKRVLGYDRYEGELACEVIVKLVLECEEKRVVFTRETKQSSYGGDNSSSLSLAGATPSLRLRSFGDLLLHWSHSNDYTEEEEWPAFIGEVFDQISSTFYSSTSLRSLDPHREL
jgi:hypothetical protein